MSWKSFSYATKPYEVLKTLTVLSSGKNLGGEGTTVAWPLGHSSGDQRSKSFNPWKPDLNLGLHYLACLSFTCLGKNIAHENILQLWQMLTYRWNIFFAKKKFISHFFSLGSASSFIFLCFHPQTSYPFSAVSILIQSMPWMTSVLLCACTVSITTGFNLLAPRGINIMQVIRSKFNLLTTTFTHSNMHHALQLTDSNRI